MSGAWRYGVRATLSGVSDPGTPHVLLAGAGGARGAAPSGRPWEEGMRDWGCGDGLVGRGFPPGFQDAFFLPLCLFFFFFSFGDEILQSKSASSFFFELLQHSYPDSASHTTFCGILSCIPPLADSLTESLLLIILRSHGDLVSRQRLQCIDSSTRTWN